MTLHDTLGDSITVLMVYMSIEPNSLPDKVITAGLGIFVSVVSRIFLKQIDIYIEARKEKKLSNKP